LDYQNSRAGFPIFHIQNAMAQQVPSHQNPAMLIYLFSTVENVQEPIQTFMGSGVLVTEFYS